MEDEDWKQRLARRLKTARGGETQESLSARSGVSARAISFIETCKLSEPPRTETLVKLADATSTDPAEWFRDAGLPPPTPDDLQRVRRGALKALRPSGVAGQFSELLESERRLDASREVWVVQGDQFSDVRAREVMETVLAKVEQGVQYRFFYPFWDRMPPRPEWCNTHEQDLESLRKCATDSSKIAGYRVDPRDFPLFSINSLLLCFYTPGGLLAQQECYRVVCLRGPDELDEALYFEEHSTAKGRTLQFLSGLVRKQQESRQAGRVKQPRPAAKRQTADLV